MYKVFILLCIYINQHRAAPVQYPEKYLQTLQISCLSGAVVRSDSQKTEGFKSNLQVKPEAHRITDYMAFNKNFQNYFH